MAILSLRIWFVAQVIFIIGVLIFCFATGIGWPEGIMVLLGVFAGGLFVSLPALAILAIIIQVVCSLSPGRMWAIVLTILGAALSAFITYSGWCLFLETDISNDWAFLIAVNGCTTLSTLLHFKSFRGFEPV